MFAALLLATPIFGFALTPPTAQALDLVDVPALVDVGVVEASAEPTPRDEHQAALERRDSLRVWHIVSGNATWFATTLTTVLGILTYRDRYGGGEEGETPCARGDTILRQRHCTGTPLPHAIGAGLLTLSFAATFSLGLAMPDPLATADSDTGHGRRLRRHKALRWVLLGLVVAQSLLGAISANVVDGFDARRNTATAHLALGLATWGTMLATGVYGSQMAY